MRKPDRNIFELVLAENNLDPKDIYEEDTDKGKFIFAKTQKKEIPVIEEIKKNTRNIVLELYNREQRELHYCAIEIAIKELKGNYKKEDIYFIEKLITTNSWWDSVDTIAKYILGQYLIEFPEMIPSIHQFVFDYFTLHICKI